MKRLLLLPLLLLVAATPQLLVELNYQQDGDVQINDYERQVGEDATRMSGEWTLELTNADGTIVSQTRYSPDMILPSGERSYVEELYIPINAPASAQSITVRDPDGVSVAAYQITGTCGDLRCDERERNSCPQDCSPAATQARQETSLEEPDQERGMGFWLTIGAAALLIIVLVLVLIHINRKKENPVQGEYREY